MYFGKAKKMQEKYLEEKEKRLNERSEHLDEKKQLLDRIEKCSKDDNTVKSTRWTRRNIIVGVIGGIVGIAAALVTAISTALGTWKVIQGVVLKAYSASAAVMVCSNVSRGRR